MIKTRLLKAEDERYSLPLLIKHLLHVTSRQESDQKLIGHPFGQISYKAFYRRVAQLAYFMRKAGLRPGDGVALIDNNSYRIPECLFTIPMCGADLHMVNTSFNEDQMAEAINMHQDKVVIVHVDFLPEIEKISGKLESVQEFIIANDGQPVPENKLDPFGCYEDLMDWEGAQVDFPDFRDDSIALTSYRLQAGKLLPNHLTHNEIVASVLAQASVQEDSYGLGFQDVYMSLLSPYKLTACLESYLATYLGIKQVYPGVLDYSVILKLIEKEGVTYTPISSGQLTSLFDRSMIDHFKVHQWRFYLKENVIPNFQEQEDAPNLRPA